jgi:5-methylcytosine-specific restriction enzyme A
VPSKALRGCYKPGCGQLTSNGYCEQHKTQPAEQAKRNDIARRQTDPFRKLYFTTLWQNTSRQVRARDVICCICNFAFSEVADHIIPARIYVPQCGGDIQAFYDQSNIQGICKPCHRVKTNKETAG